MTPARRTASQQPGVGTKRGSIFEDPLGPSLLLIVKKDRTRMSAFLITYFKELTLLKLVGSVRNETDLGNDL